MILFMGGDGARHRARDPAADLPAESADRKMIHPSQSPTPATERSGIQSAGFTLIEVLVVVAILGILAAIVVPRIMDRPDEAKRVAAKADIARDRPGAQALPPRQRRLSHHRPGPPRAGAAARDQPRARQLEAGRLPRAPAEGSVGRRLPVPEPRREAARSTSSASGPTARAAARAMRADIGNWDYEVASPSSRCLVVVAITGIMLALAAVNLFPSDAQVARREAGVVGARDRARARRGVARRAPDVDHLRHGPAARVALQRRRRGGRCRAAIAGSRRCASTGTSTSTGRQLDAGRAPGVHSRRARHAVPRRARSARPLPQAIEGDAAGAVRLVEG